MKIVMVDKQHQGPGDFNARAAAIFSQAKNHEFTRVDPDEWRGPSKDHYNVALIHAEMDCKPFKINADVIVLFDCEDDSSIMPKGKGNAYDAWLDSADYYAKLAIPSAYSIDGNLERIHLPFYGIMNSRDMALRIDSVPEFTYENAIPSFLGSSTQLGWYRPQQDVAYSNDGKTQCMTHRDGENFYYSQRIDWLMQLQNANYFYTGGIYFRGDDSLGTQWQSERFGDVARFAANGLPYDELIKMMCTHRINLCPAGHSRWGPRLYDVAATAGICISTDHNDEIPMYLPPEMIEIEDGGDLPQLLDDIRPDLKDLAKAAHKNKEWLLELTPDRMTDDFLAQVF